MSAIEPWLGRTGPLLGEDDHVNLARLLNAMVPSTSAPTASVWARYIMTVRAEPRPFLSPSGWQESLYYEWEDVFPAVHTWAKVSDFPKKRELMAALERARRVRVEEGIQERAKTQKALPAGDEQETLRRAKEKALAELDETFPAFAQMLRRARGS